MVIGAGVRLHVIVRPTNAGVGLDGRSPTGFIGLERVPGRTGVVTVPGGTGGVKGVRAPKLVAHLVRDKVDVEAFPSRVRKAGDALCLTPLVTGAVHGRNAPTAGAEHVANIVVGRADDSVHRLLIFAEHDATIVVGIRVVSSVAID